MNWADFRLSKRLALSATDAETVFSAIAEIDAVKKVWRITDTLIPQTIERLTQSVIVTSAGASNRIEGNRLTDAQVEALYRNMHIKKFKTRDEQEVAGYIEVLQTIFTDFDAIPVKESTILQMHRDMLRHSDKDRGHLGQYKFGPSRVEAKDQSGNLVGIIFDPTPPHLTPKEVHELCDWYNWATEAKFKHPLILTANFLFEYLAIHPFQDGNGRTSRLLTNLMLLRQGYDFAKVVSHERLVEDNKVDYYLALNKTQSTRKSDAENMTPWLTFFFAIMRLQAQKALALLEGDRIEDTLSEKQLALWQWANGLADKTFTRKMAVEALGFPPRTIEAIIKKLVDLKRLDRTGESRATRYRVKDRVKAP
ncbi:MAG: Fic family protein [Alphaproteobacteria bacterium]|nr:MAG: Fic family protein [Alphaproteobacteria bacterium]